MLVEIDGQQYDVPDNATPAHIQKALNLHAPTPPQSFQDKFIPNLFAGATRGLAGLANIPYDLVKSQEGAANIDPYEQKLRQAIGEKPYQLPAGYAEKIPHFGEHDYSKMFGITGEPTMSDKAIQFGSEFALPIGGGLIKGGPKALRFLGDLPLTKKMAAKSLNKAVNLVGERQIGSLNVPNELIEDTRQFLPQTTPYRKLLENAMSKEYKPLFDLQSDVGHQSRDYIKSLFSAAERAHGREGAASRNRLIDAMRQGLHEQGHGDIADLMKHGQNRYRQYIKYRDIRNKVALSLLPTGAAAYKPIKNYLYD